ncbi:MAG: hypothetical protein ACLTDX_10895 [[Clostridium] innocuum]|uniref:hypothetical protein n=1 Tax=Clostridium sp. TaxID=1506 RepID=UPI003992CC0A
MENNQIALNLTEEISVELSADTTDMQTLIDKIVENRDIINIKNISVTIPEGSNFDKEGFECMIKNVIKEYLETLKLEENNFVSK